MDKIRTPMQVIRVGVKCESCAVGELIHKPNSMSMDMDWVPPRYRHECNNCGKAAELPRVYPTVEYEPVVANVSQD